MPDSQARNGSPAFGCHILLWLALTLFPVSLTATGDVNTAQFALHGTMAVVMIGLIVVVAFRWPVAMPPAPLAGAVILATAAIGYFALLSSLSSKSGSAGDIADVFRPAVYFAYFAFPFLIPIEERRLRRLLFLLIALAVFQIAFSALVYFPPAWEIVNIYKGRTSEDFLLFHFFRWSGTHAYPSDFAFYLSFFFYLFFVARHRIFSRTVDYVLLSVIGVAILLTMSRGGIATVAAMTMFGAALFGRARPMIVFSILAIAAAVALVAVDRYVEADIINTDYAIDLIDQDTDSSTRHRVAELELAAEYGAEYFPFGLGAARDEIYSRIRVIESLYGHYFVKWGVVGFLLYTISVVYLAIASWSIWRHSEDLVIRYFGAAFFLLTLSIPMVFGLSSAVSDRFKGLPFFYLLAGYAANLYERRRAARARNAHGTSALPT